MNVRHVVEGAYRKKARPPAHMDDSELEDWLGMESLEDEELDAIRAYLAKNYTNVDGRLKDNRSIVKQKEREQQIAAASAAASATTPRTDVAPTPEAPAPTPEAVAASPIVLPVGWQDFWEEWVEAGHILIRAFRPKSDAEVDQFCVDMDVLMDMFRDKVPSHRQDIPTDEFGVAINEEQG